jgi:23S rRNA pseudouridine1911/1915/1917 synthase
LPDQSEQNRIFIIEPENEGLRADVYLASALPGLSRSRIQELIREGFILLNDRPVKNGKKLEAGDRITCSVPAPVPLKLEPVPMELSIIYEDDCLLVINKPQGLVVHPAPGSGDKTLVHGLLAHCGDLSGINGVLRPGIVHRLDKDTSGLLAVAKKDAAHRCLAGQIQDGTMKRQYLAVVWGVIDEPAGIIDAPIGRDPRDRQKMAAIAGGKKARTDYKVLDRLKDKTVVQCDLQSGRTHQIRVHMKLLGHPVVGDPKYGRRRDDPAWAGQALHAWSLQFCHPENQETMKFFAPLPYGYRRFIVEEQAENTQRRIKELEDSSSVPTGI